MRTPRQPENVCHSIGGRDFWIEAVGFRKLLACLCTLTGPFESHAQVIVGPGEVGVEPNRFPVLGDSVVILALGGKGEAQANVWAGAKSGLSRMASLYSAIAASDWPLSSRSEPRLM